MAFDLTKHINDFDIKRSMIMWRFIQRQILGMKWLNEGVEEVIVADWD